MCIHHQIWNIQYLVEKTITYALNKKVTFMCLKNNNKITSFFGKVPTEHEKPKIF